MEYISPYAKAYAAAAVAVVLFIVDGLMTGSFTDTSSIAPALTILLAPLVVFLIPNSDPHEGHPEVEHYDFENDNLDEGHTEDGSPTGNIIDPNDPRA